MVNMVDVVDEVDEVELMVRICIGLFVGMLICDGGTNAYVNVDVDVAQTVIHTRSRRIILLESIIV